VSFVHLHNHSGYSLVDGLSRVPALVEAAAADGQRAVAVTDHGGLGGWFALHDACAKNTDGPYPIYGAEFYLAYGSRFERDPVQFDGIEDDEDGSGDKHNYHLTLLAENEAGYRNLIILNNLAQDQFWHKPRIDTDLLAEHSEGVIVLTGCLGGPITSHLVHGDKAGAARNLKALIEAVGKANVYVEMMEHGIDHEAQVQELLVRLATKYDVPWVVTNDCHFTDESDERAHEAWLTVGQKKGGKAVTLNDEDRWRFPGSGYWLKTAEQMRAARDEDWWQAGCDETERIAQRIGRDVMPSTTLHLPVFPQVPDQFTDSATYLRHLVREGALARYGEDPDRPGKLPAAVNARLKYEFDVINGAGLADYFLIVWDMVTWARDNGILVGPGRGSAAGCCIAYCLQITADDPIANGLLFERFLNPERAGMPDIDIDFEKDRRHEVISHLVDVYGADCVARIGTRGVVRARQAIKDAARVLGVSVASADTLASLIPLDGAKPRSLRILTGPDAASDPSNTAFLDAVKALGDRGGEIVNLALRFEDVPRSESIHACGVLVSDQSLMDLVPMRRDREGEKDAADSEHVTRVTTWEGGELEASGFLKMDVLAIRNLDVLAQARDNILVSTGEHVDVAAIDPANVSDVHRDQAAWDLIAEGRTEGVFQLESAKMTELAMDVRPTELEDITALVALYRPGPMSAGMHTKYAARKRGRESIDYSYLTRASDELGVIASVLDVTFGTIVYQEQLQQLGGVVAGLTPGMKNKLQKAFSKKKADLMAEVREAFFAGGTGGAGDAGIKFSTETLEALWTTFEGSASYLFNKSHAAAYGHLAYTTAYVKANWPTEYGAALLATTDKDDKRAAILRSLVSEGITIHAPDINASTAETQPDVVHGGIRLGLSEIKGVGKIAHHIVAERDNDGPFRSLTDLMRRVNAPTPKGTLQPITTAAVEALIEAGALDEFGPRKGLVRIARAARADRHLQPTGEWGVFERSQRQRARTGVTLGEHPLIVHADEVLRAIARSSFANRPMVRVGSLSSVHNGTVVVVPGIMTQWAERSYSKGRMASVVLEGGGGEQVTLVVWNEELNALKASGTQVRLGHPVLIQAKVEAKQYSVDVTLEDGTIETQTVERTSLMARSIEPLAVDEGTGMEDFDEPGAAPPRRSDVGASIIVRALPQRGPAPEAPVHVVPLDSLQNLTPTSWVKANSGSVTPLVYAVAPADSPLETMRDAIDGDADLASVDRHGWAVVTPASIEMF